MTLPRDSSVVRHFSFPNCRKLAVLAGLSSVFRLRLSLRTLYEHFFLENKHMGMHTYLIAEPRITQRTFSLQSSMGCRAAASKDQLFLRAEIC